MDEFELLLTRLVELYPTVDHGTYRKQYQRVGHIAHGWAQRCVNAAQGIMLLQENGFAGEAPPLARSLVEHTVALRWLIAKGAGILVPLKAVHKRETDNYRAAFLLSDGDGNEKYFDEVVKSLEYDTKHPDLYMHQFVARARAHGAPGDLTFYSGHVMLSHATYQSAIVYWDQSAPEKFDIPRVFPRESADYRRLCAAHVYIALNCYSQIFLARPWVVPLSEIRAALVAAGPELDAIL